MNRVVADFTGLNNLCEISSLNNIQALDSVFWIQLAITSVEGQANIARIDRAYDIDRYIVAGA